MEHTLCGLCTHRRLRRRRRVLVGVVGVVVGALALGGATVSASGAASTASVGGGVLKWAANLSGTAASVVALDPAQGLSTGADVAWQLPVYDSLLHTRPDGSFAPGLATSATLVDPKTITVELRQGVKFQDGSPFNADAVKAGIERNMNAPQRGQFRAPLLTVSSIDVTGPYALRINFAQPVGGAFYPLLAGQDTFIMSPTAVAAKSLDELAKAPVGAGPFKVASYTPGQQIELVRNPDYWDARDVRLGGITFIQSEGGPTTVNALAAGTVDFATNLSVTDAEAVAKRGSVKVSYKPLDNSALWFPVCKAKPPFDDARVRQALNYALDREAINKAVLDGRGAPQWALWPETSVNFPKDLKGHFAYNLAKARKLLKAAGYAKGFKTSMLPINGVTAAAQVAEIAQEQWRKIGVNVEIRQTSDFVGDLYVRNQAPIGLIPASQPGIGKISGPYQTGSLGDLCKYDNPKINAIVTQLSAVAPGSKEAVKLWSQAQHIVVGDALSVWAVFAPATAVWNSALKGVRLVPSVYGYTLDLWNRATTLK